MTQPQSQIFRRRANPLHVARCTQLTEDLVQRYGVGRECVIARAGDWEVLTPGGLYFMRTPDLAAQFEPVTDALEQAQSEYFLTLLTVDKAPRIAEDALAEVCTERYWDAPARARKAY